MKLTDITKIMDPTALLRSTTQAISGQAVEAILAQLPIVPEPDYRYNGKNPAETWQEGMLHWYPVGGDRGNAAASSWPVRREPHRRASRQRHRGADRTVPPNGVAGGSCRCGAAVAARPCGGTTRFHRSTNCPSARSSWQKGNRPAKEVTDLADRIRVSMRQEGKGKDYTVFVDDDGIGQTAVKMHETLLSLGCSDKPDKPYLIGMFGQGGSSAFAASVYSWFVSRLSAIARPQRRRRGLDHRAADHAGRPPRRVLGVPGGAS